MRVPSVTRIAETATPDPAAPPVADGSLACDRDTPGTNGLRRQFGSPRAVLSSQMLGATRTSRLTTRRPMSRGRSDTSASTRPTVIISGREPPSALASATSRRFRMGDHPQATVAGPRMTRSRPVACFTAASICGLYRSGAAIPARTATVPAAITPKASSARTALRIRPTIELLPQLEEASIASAALQTANASFRTHGLQLSRI